MHTKAQGKRRSRAALGSCSRMLPRTLKEFHNRAMWLRQRRKGAILVHVLSFVRRTLERKLWPQSLVQIYVHVVFSTKQRKPFLNDVSFREQTHAYLAGICQNTNCPPLKIGGVEDHVHILCRLGKQIDISGLIKR